MFSLRLFLLDCSIFSFLSFVHGLIKDLIEWKDSFSLSLRMVEVVVIT